MNKFFIWVLLLNVVVMPICLFLADFFFEEYLDIVLTYYKITFGLMVGMLIVDLTIILMRKKGLIKWK